MGSGNSAPLPTSTSDSETDSDLYCVEENNAGKCTTDALINGRKTVTFPKPSNTLDFHAVIDIEQQLENYELVSVIYLLSDDAQWALMQLTSLLNDSPKEFLLLRWAEDLHKCGQLWQNKLVEALCIIQNYKVLRKLGYQKDSLVSHFLPQQQATVLHLNKFRKVLYLMCEKMNKSQTNRFIQLAQEMLDIGRRFERFNENYLELYFLYWEQENIISQNNVDKILRILKIMGDVPLETMLSSVVPRTRAPEAPRRFETFEEISNLQVRDDRRERRRRTSTSVDDTYGGAGHRQSTIENLIPLATTYKDHVYHVDEKYPGTVLIINQEDFYTEPRPDFQELLPPNIDYQLEKRTGTERDRDYLRDVFENFGFNVIVENNLPHTMVIDKIKEVVKGVKNESSLFVCILSHGDEGVIYGVNSCKIDVSAIKNIICNSNKKYLNGKPKILILQSCQGSKLQTIHSATSESIADECHEDITTDGFKQNVPSLADMLVCWATVPGYAAIRNMRQGSWFIQALCQKMEELSERYHFADICTRTNSDVNTRQWIRGIDRNVMTPVVISTLTKDFYLPPKKKSLPSDLSCVKL